VAKYSEWPEIRVDQQDQHDRKNDVDESALHVDLPDGDWGVGKDSNLPMLVWQPRVVNYLVAKLQIAPMPYLHVEHALML
jgi:hypothetical protein